MPGILQINGQSLQINGQDLQINASEAEPEVITPATQPKGKGKGRKQQIYSSGPWAYR